MDSYCLQIINLVLATVVAGALFMTGLILGKQESYRKGNQTVDCVKCKKLHNKQSKKCKEASLFPLENSIKSYLTEDNFSVLNYFTSIKNLSNSQVHQIMITANKCRDLVRNSVHNDILKDKVLCTLFYEVSTRTRCSFEVAMLRLGGHVFTVNEATSSIRKGESLEDTVEVLSAYADIIVLRHPDEGSAIQAASIIKTRGNSKNCFLINAGNGTDEHPTQCLVDLYTILNYFPDFLSGKGTPLNVVFVGDLLHGRTAHSLALLLSNYNTRFTYVSLKNLQMPNYIKNAVESNFAKHGISECRQDVNSDIKTALIASDIIYVTRLQKERITNNNENEKIRLVNEYESLYINSNLLDSYAPKHAKVLHPFPRLDELNKDVDQNIRAAYFTQSENGLYVRMALLLFFLNRPNNSLHS